MTQIKKMTKKHLLLISTLMISLLFLAGCQSNNNQQAETMDAIEVSYKYPENEVEDFINRRATHMTKRYENITLEQPSYLTEPNDLPASLYYDSGIHIAYPQDGVRGLYLTATNVGNPEYFKYIIDFIKKSKLNSVVIDFKDDWGHIIPPNDSENEWVKKNTIQEVNYKEILKVLEENNIYPIARITTFKDNLLSDSRPDLSFTDPKTGEVWHDANGAQFLNPFMQENWDYILDVSIQAAKMGFKDIQFDYVRFPEGFFEYADSLKYEIGRYKAYQTDDPEKEGYERVAAINDFLAYARNHLTPYGVKVSADIFGYTTIAGDTYDVRGIGQNFAQMAEQVDTVSAMIYPSHWGPAFFNITSPDLYPFEVVDNYIFAEKELLAKVANKVNSRPWLQDFTDSSLPAGTYQNYGIPQVQAQVDALANHGIREFLLWNASGEYTEGVNYYPDIAPGSIDTSHMNTNPNSDTGADMNTHRQQTIIQ